MSSREDVATIRSIRRELAEQLALAGLAEAQHEALLIVAGTLAWPVSRLLAEPEHRVSLQQAEQLRRRAVRRAGHEPLAYILGQTAFGGLDFVVGPGTLVPRPDSEVLVETARRLLAERGSRGEVRLLDTCTGSGAIGICLAWQLDQDGYRVRLSLVDREADALAWARRNSRLLPERVALRVIQADLFPGDEDPYDLVTANPPYIPSDQIDHLMPEVSVHEPRMALDGGPDGLAFYRRLAGQAPAHLRRDGFLVLEHGYDQADAISAILSAQGFAVRPAVLDFGGHLRVTAGQAVQ